MTVWESRWFRAGAGVAVVAVAALLVWLLAIRDGGAEGGPGTGDVTVAEEPSQPVEASELDLAALAGVVDHPIYWLGEREGTKTEVTRLRTGEIYVRYLDEDAEVGDPRPRYLTVGTYPLEGAYEALEDLAEQEGSTDDRAEDGALVVQTEENPTSVHLAYPDRDLQIEVFDPDSERAMRIALSGRLRPVR